MRKRIIRIAALALCAVVLLPYMGLAVYAIDLTVFPPFQNSDGTFGIYGDQSHGFKNFVLVQRPTEQQEYYLILTDRDEARTNSAGVVLMFGPSYKLMPNNFYWEYHTTLSGQGFRIADTLSPALNYTVIYTTIDIFDYRGNLLYPGLDVRNYDFTIEEYITEESYRLTQYDISDMPGFTRDAIIAWTLAIEYGDTYPYYYFADKYLVLSKRPVLIGDNGWIGNMPYYVAHIDRDDLLLAIEGNTLSVYSAVPLNAFSELRLALFRGIGSLDRGEAVYFNGLAHPEALFFDAIEQAAGFYDFKPWTIYEEAIEDAEPPPSPPPGPSPEPPPPSPSRHPLENELDTMLEGRDKNGVANIKEVVGPVELGEEGTGALMLLVAVAQLFTGPYLGVGILIIIIAAVVAGVIGKGKH